MVHYIVKVILAQEAGHEGFDCFYYNGVGADNRALSKVCKTIDKPYRKGGNRSRLSSWYTIGWLIMATP